MITSIIAPSGVGITRKMLALRCAFVVLSPGRFWSVTGNDDAARWWAPWWSRGSLAGPQAPGRGVLPVKWLPRILASERSRPGGTRAFNEGFLAALIFTALHSSHGLQLPRWRFPLIAHSKRTPKHCSHYYYFRVGQLFLAELCSLLV